MFDGPSGMMRPCRARSYRADCNPVEAACPVMNASMRMFRFDQAMTIILVILVVVIAVEQISSAIRKRVI